MEAFSLKPRMWYVCQTVKGTVQYLAFDGTWHESMTTTPGRRGGQYFRSQQEAIDAIDAITAAMEHADPILMGY